MSRIRVPSWGRAGFSANKQFVGYRFAHSVQLAAEACIRADFPPDDDSDDALYAIERSGNIAFEAARHIYEGISYIEYLCPGQNLANRKQLATKYRKEYRRLRERLAALEKCSGVTPLEELIEEEYQAKLRRTPAPYALTEHQIHATERVDFDFEHARDVKLVSSAPYSLTEHQIHQHQLCRYADGERSALAKPMGAIKTIAVAAVVALSVVPHASAGYVRACGVNCQPLSTMIPLVNTFVVSRPLEITDLNVASNVGDHVVATRVAVARATLMPTVSLSSYEVHKTLEPMEMVNSVARDIASMVSQFPELQFLQDWQNEVSADAKRREPERIPDG